MQQHQRNEEELRLINPDAMAPNRAVEIVVNAIKQVNSKRRWQKCGMITLSPITCCAIWCCSFWPIELTAECESNSINALITTLTKDPVYIQPENIQNLRDAKRLTGNVDAQIKAVLNAITNTIAGDQTIPQDYVTALLAAKELIKSSVDPNAKPRLVKMLETDGADARDASESRDFDLPPKGYQ